jgi:tetratricopeptide (TPR) repeat protein
MILIQETAMKLTRLTALAITVGTLAAAGTLYASGLRNQAEGLRVEDWPICSSVGLEAEWAALDPDLTAGKIALAKGYWTSAIRTLEFASVRDPRNADIMNYLGYAYLRLSQHGPAMGYFQQALSINPRHHGAHEHLGELFLALKETSRAEAQLAELMRVCLLACEEVGRLQQAIQAKKEASRR